MSCYDVFSIRTFGVSTNLLRPIETMYLIQKQNGSSTQSMKVSMTMNSSGFICCATNLPVSESSPLASSNTARTSFVPEFVAESSLSTASVLLANNRANVVFPQPLGPQRIMLPVEPFAPWSKCIRRESAPVKCSCPTNSERSVGRRRSARGARFILAGEVLGLFAGRKFGSEEPWLSSVNNGSAGRFPTLNMEETALDVSLFFIKNPGLVAEEVPWSAAAGARQLESKCRFISSSVTFALQIGHCTFKTVVNVSCQWRRERYVRLSTCTRLSWH